MIYTGKYDNCKSGNLISISGDRGKKIGFEGKAMPMFAPKLKFWKEWESNIGKVSEYDNTKFYINEYYKQVLVNLDILDILEKETKPILLCYEDSNEFCHRHVLAEYIELKYGLIVREIEIDEEGIINVNERPKYIKDLLIDVIKENNLEELQVHACKSCEYALSPELVDSIIEENAEYRNMDYDQAVKQIGHCEITPYDYDKENNCHCDFYYPNEECLSRCRKPIRNNKN